MAAPRRSRTGESPAAVAPPATGRTDRFPDQTELVRDLLSKGDELAAIHLVMDLYRSALEAYFAGSSFRHRFPADESAESVVSQFISDRVSHPGFLTTWLEARSRFRYWLLVAFANHMRHHLRRERAEHRRRERLAARSTARPRDTVRDRFDAEVARSLIRTAMRSAEQACRAEGRGADWDAFVAHAIEGLSFGEIARRTGRKEPRIANEVRFAKGRLVLHIQKALSLTGSSTREELRAELSRLEEALARCPN